MSDMRGSGAYAWIKQTLGLLALILAGIGGLQLLQAYLEDRPIDLLTTTETLAIRFERTLEQSLIPADTIRLMSRRAISDRTAAWNVYHYDVQVPPSVSMDGLVRLLRARMGSDVVVHDIPESETEIALSLLLADHEFVIARLHTESPPAANVASDPASAPPPAPAEHVVTAPLSPMLPVLHFAFEERGPQIPLAPQPAKLAIILDDGGHGGELTEAVLQLDPRLTLAILPGTPEGAATASRGADRGFEIMLHMPMESHDPNEMYEGSLTTDMEPEQIADVFARALEEVPHASGVNNHTGSKFCEDADAMAVVLEEVKERGLYFVDSRTLHTTVAFDVATRLGVPAAERDVFLDHDNTREAILAQWDALIAVCRAQGSAVGIGHFRPLTVAILAEKLPELERLGIVLVHASEVVNHAAPPSVTMDAGLPAVIRTE